MLIELLRHLKTIAAILITMVIMILGTELIAAYPDILGWSLVTLLGFLIYCGFYVIVNG